MAHPVQTEAHRRFRMHHFANDDRFRARIEEDPMNSETPWTDGGLALPLERGASTARAAPHAGMRAPVSVVRPPRRNHLPRSRGREQGAQHQLIDTIATLAADASVEGGSKLTGKAAMQKQLTGSTRSCTTTWSHRPAPPRRSFRIRQRQ
jgi:hypothetical protein